MSTISNLLVENITKLTTCKPFQNWLEEEKPANDDLIIINNSFIFRGELSTSKNDYYLTIPFQSLNAIKPTSLQFVEKFRLVDNFKKASPKSKNLVFSDFHSLVRRWQKNLGQFVFILLGRLDENQAFEREIKSKHLERIVFDPTASTKVSFNGKTLIIRDLTDEEVALNELKKSLTPASNHKLTDWEETSSAVRDSIVSLHDDRFIPLYIPNNETVNTPVFIETVNTSLKRHLQMYDFALKKWLENNDIPEHLNELLRISYTFAGEAIKFVKLIVSISDLKPLLLWTTVYEQFMLAEAFKQICYIGRAKKAKVNDYIQIVNTARNKAFHNIFDFDAKIIVNLNGQKLTAKELVIFSEYSKKKENRLTYEEQDMVDLMTQFTRAKTKRVAPDFWKLNREVIEKTIALLDATTYALKIFAQETQSVKFSSARQARSRKMVKVAKTLKKEAA